MTRPVNRVVLWAGLAAAIILLGVVGHVFYVLRYEADYSVMIRAAERALDQAGGDGR